MPRKHCEGNYSNGWWLSMLHSLAKASGPPMSNYNRIGHQKWEFQCRVEPDKSWDGQDPSCRTDQIMSLYKVGMWVVSYWRKWNLQKLNKSWRWTSWLREFLTDNIYVKDLPMLKSRSVLNPNLKLPRLDLVPYRTLYFNACFSI